MILLSDSVFPSTDLWPQLRVAKRRADAMCVCLLGGRLVNKGIQCIALNKIGDATWARLSLCFVVRLMDWRAGCHLNSTRNIPLALFLLFTPFHIQLETWVTAALRGSDEWLVLDELTVFAQTSLLQFFYSLIFQQRLLDESDESQRVLEETMMSSPWTSMEKKLFSKPTNLGFGEIKLVTNH